MRLDQTTFLHFLSQVVISVAGFASRFAIGYFLGEAVLGQYAVAVGLGFFWLPLAGMAVARATTKYVSEGTAPGAYLAAGFLANAGIAATTGVAILAGGTLLGVAFPDSSVPFVTVLAAQKELVAGLAVAAILFQTAMEGLAGLHMVEYQGGLAALERMVRTTGQLAFILAGVGLFGLLVGHVFSLLLVAVLAVLLYDVGFARPRREHFERLFGYSRFGWASTFQGRVFGWMDVIVLSLFVTDGQIGIYEAAWGLGSLLATVSASVRSSLFPEISELAANEEFDRIRNVLGEGIVFSGVFVIPGLFGVAIMGERVLRVYRPSFGRGAGILVILVLAYVADVYGSQFVSALNAVDRPDVTYRINLLFIGLNLVLNVGLVWQFGWYGAAVATAVSATVRSVLAIWRVNEFIGRPAVPVRAIGWEVVASAGMAVALWLVLPFAPGSRAFTVVLVLFGAGVYATLLVALSSLVRRKLWRLAGPFSPVAVE
jgi:O-antigen/teichoic acid export membrane protein